MEHVEKILGKIDVAEYGKVSDYPFLIGVQLEFSLAGGSMGIADGGKYTVNISKECKWGEKDRNLTITETVEKLNALLSDAKVNYVSELVGKPVEVTTVNGRFSDFRILKEVL